VQGAAKSLILSYETNTTSLIAHGAASRYWIFSMIHFRHLMRWLRRILTGTPTAMNAEPAFIRGTVKAANGLEMA